MILEVKGLRQRSPRGNLVLDGVSLQVHAGEIYGLAGVEGNGQSELVRAITEQVRLESGDVALEGVSVLSWDVRTRRDRGIGHIPEDRHRYGLLLPFSLAENLVLGRHHLQPLRAGIGGGLRQGQVLCPREHRQLRHPHPQRAHPGATPCRGETSRR